MIRNTLPISKQRNICGFGRHCSCNTKPSVRKSRNKGVKLALKKAAFKRELDNE